MQVIQAISSIWIPCVIVLPLTPGRGEVFKSIQWELGSSMNDFFACFNNYYLMFVLLFFYFLNLKINEPVDQWQYGQKLMKISCLLRNRLDRKSLWLLSKQKILAWKILQFARDFLPLKYCWTKNAFQGEIFHQRQFCIIVVFCLGFLKRLKAFQ